MKRLEYVLPDTSIQWFGEEHIQSRYQVKCIKLEAWRKNFTQMNERVICATKQTISKYLLPKPSGHPQPRATMSDDGFDGGGVGDDYDYGGGYVNIVIRSFWSINPT